MLGVGIFLMPTQVAQNVNSVTLFLAMWFIGGLMAFAGSVACGELGTMMPQAGGDYVFQRRAYGPSMAFASGWVLFGAIFSGSIASMSVAVFQYQIGPLLGVDLMAPVVGGITAAQLCAIALIALLTFLNDAGTRVSVSVQTVLTLLPIATLVVVAVYALSVAQPVKEVVAEAAATDTTLTLAGIAAAFLAVNFAYSGWLNIIYVAGEVRNPGRDVPRAMLWGTAIVTGLYLLLCLAFVSVLGLGGVAALGWTDAGSGLAAALGKPWLATTTLIVIAVAIVTSLNATVLASARVGYAMANDGAFLRAASVLSGPRRVPRLALWIQALIASVLVVSGTFEEVVKMTSVAMFVTGALTVSAVFVLRRREPNTPRPYRALLYPWLPGFYVLAAVAVIIIELTNMFSGKDNAWFPLLGLALFALAYIGHRLLREGSAP